MRQRHRVPLPRVFPALVIIGLLISVPAFPAGFQVMTQGARATGLGLAFTGIADDPSAIFYNPAGMAFQDHFSLMSGGSIFSRASADFSGANPYPGVGDSESVQKQQFLLPNVYAVAPLTQELSFGLGIDAPYGLGLRWNDPEAFSGRFISQNAVIQTTDINPVFSYKLFPTFSIAAGADWRFSKVQLERNTNLGIVDPFTGAVEDLAHVKLNSSLTSNSAWGWNAAFLWKPSPNFGLGASYRSTIKVNYDGTVVFTQRYTGNPVVDGIVTAALPQGEHPVATSIKFPASLNIGASIGGMPGGLLLALEADWTMWSSFSALNITFPDGVAPDIDRATNWTDTWAYRVGLEKKFTEWAVRVGYYYDNTPQPTVDVGPLLADSDRNVFTGGFSYSTPQWGVDIGGAYIVLKDRSVLTQSTDNFFGTYSETAWVASANLRISF